MASHKKSIYPELGFLQWKKSIPINVMDSYFSWKQRFEVEWWICFLQTHSFSLDHCRWSTGEQVMLHFSKSVLMKKGEYIFTRFLGELFISAAWNLYQERMGPNFNTKTPETRCLHLMPRCLSNCFEKKRRCYTMVKIPTILRPVAGIKFKMSSFWA